MDKEILNKLKINLQELEQKKDEKEKKIIQRINKNTETAYYQIWKQILKQMNKKEEFIITFNFGNHIQIIEVNDIPTKVIMCNKINHQKLYNSLLKDGLDCGYFGLPTKGLILYIKVNELKKIEEKHESQKNIEVR